MLNREKESNGRVIKNAPALLAALVARFGAQRVHPRVESPATLDMPAMIALLRDARILVSPHGSQNSNAGFLSPGAALLEVQAAGCQENRGYRVMSQLWGLHYAAVFTKGARSATSRPRSARTSRASSPSRRSWTARSPSTSRTGRPGCARRWRCRRARRATGGSR